jgi:hypothetical protein
MPSSIKIVFFEDTEETRSEILGALKAHAKPDGTVIPFDSTHLEESAQEKDRMFEHRLETILNREPYAGVTLVVADRDLSKSPNFKGLSVNAVAAASRKLDVPICSYARQPEVDDYDWRGRWEEGHIVLHLSEGEDDLARRATVAARGFAEIGAKLPDVLAVKTNNSAAKALSALLGKPEYSEKIALYGVGDQNRLSEVLAQAKHAEQRVQKMTHFLGYWLWDSLLRYPGLLVNEVAAGSYLNINEDDFRDTKVQALFQEALYQGPFQDSKRPHWWRGALDDLVAKGNYTDGLGLAQTELNPEIDRSHCCVDPSKSAGYYCIISKKPVSLENSKGGLSWFPRGADLTRISNTKFDEYGPWLGA